MSPPPGRAPGNVRGGLQAYLASLPPPPRAGGPPTLPEADDGTVSVPFPRGAVHLAPAAPGRTRAVRLVWERDAPGEPRHVPPGEYRVTNYQVIRERDGRAWILSCTGRAGPPASVRAGRDTPLPLDGPLRIRCGAARTDSGYRFDAAVTGAGGMQASILDTGRDSVDRRPPVTFHVLDSEGRDLGGGTLAYG